MNGGILGSVNSITTDTASGVWDLDEQKLALQQNIWPLGIGITPTIDYLIVAGGGGGGGRFGGGGGAGGLLAGTNLAVTSGPLITTTNFRKAYADTAYSAQGWIVGTDFTGTSGTFVYSITGIQQTSGGARTIVLPSSGNIYFELLISSFNFPLIGLARDSSVGGYNNVPSVFLTDGGRYGGLGGVNLGAFAAGDVLRIAYKADTAKVFIGRNNTWNEDPVSGAGTTIPGTGDFRIIFMSGSGSATANGTFRNPAQNTYSVPTGYTSPVDTSATTTGPRYIITVGAGGSGGTSGTSTGGAVSGNLGSDSSLVQSGSTSLISIGGGGGGGWSDTQNSTAKKNGGSGGGAGWGTSLNTGGSATSGQGNAGGSGSTSSTGFGGGGGGAGQAGAAGTSTVGGAGGNGLESSITGSAVFYAGGGGGASGTTFGAGGSGGGGTAAATTGGSGTANRGGGGGSVTGAVSASVIGGAGGSGIVIIRYPRTYQRLKSSNITGSPIFSVVGDYNIYTFTGSGSIIF